jgi:hypothetical protein
MTTTNAQTATYAWIIDTDLLELPGHSNRDLTGPSHAPAAMLHQLETDPDAGDKFRMLDDDGEIYYLGRILGGGADANDDAAFGPLTDFGMPDSGCTDIQYQDVRGKWVSL